MGRENNIKTGVTGGARRGGGISLASYNMATKLPSSVYQYGIVLEINTITRSIIYNVIEDNVASTKKGFALPLYKNKIQLPNIDYVVPILRGPDVNIGSISSQYSKTTYYLDPIGIWQSVDENIIQRSVSLSPLANEANVNRNNITQASIGIPLNGSQG